VKLEVREHQFCWSVLARAMEPGIPPGEAYLVDKETRTVLPRRWIDVMRLQDPTMR
jgi:hypothetical protein